LSLTGETRIRVPEPHRSNLRGESNGEKEKKEKGKTALEQRFRDGAKGCSHTGSGKANSTCTCAPWGSSAQRSGTLLGSYRHHAAGAGATQSDRQRRETF